MPQLILKVSRECARSVHHFSLGAGKSSHRSLFLLQVAIIHAKELLPGSNLPLE